MSRPPRSRPADRNSTARVWTWAARGAGLLLLLAPLLWCGWVLLTDQPLSRAERAYERGSWLAAATEARSILRADPGQPEALTLLARAEARLGRDQSARNIYRNLDPAGLQAEDYFLVGRGLVAEGQVEGGRYGLERALELDSGHPEALLELARLDRRSDRLAEAGAEAARLAEVPRWESRGLVLLGLVRLDQGDPAAAADAFRSALERDSRLDGVEEGSTDQVRRWLAQCLLRTGRPAEAREHLEALLSTRPDDAEAHFLLSRTALQQHDRAAAMAALEHAGDFGADHPEAFEWAPYVGPERCADCHRAVYRAQRSSHHAQTFHARGDLDDLPLPDAPRDDPSGPEVVHTLAREGRDVTFHTRTPGGELRAIVEFAMGSGDRATTLVGRDSDRNWREFRLSYYASIDGWDRTPSHQARPESPHEMLGLVQTEDALRRCLGCHTTHARVGPDGPVVPSERGFSCERCHGPAGNHLDAIALEFPDPAIARPRLASAARVNALCGQCHSARGRGIDADDPDLARFQASALPLSRCMTAGPEPTMSCLTCHDPHRDAETSPAFYESKCLSCHAPGSESSRLADGHGARHVGASPLGGARNAVCPVNASEGCLSCHMPKVQTSVPHTTFTDHYIRVGPAARVGSP